MKKKLALLMAAIMTVAMVPMTAFAATTDINAVDQVKTAVDSVFASRVELKDDESTDVTKETSSFMVEVKLTNGKFAEGEDNNGDDYYLMNGDGQDGRDKYEVNGNVAGNKITLNGVNRVKVINDTTAEFEIDINQFYGQGCVITLLATADEAGEVKATFSTNKTVFADATEVIATAYPDEVAIESEGVVTFVEDGTSLKKLKDITISGLVNNAIGNATITFKLKGNYEFHMQDHPGNGMFLDKDGNTVSLRNIVTFLNDTGVVNTADADVYVEEDGFRIVLNNVAANQITKIRLSGIYIKPTKSCDPGDVAKLTVSSKDFDSTTLEVAKMVEEAVTYTVEDDDLPTIWAGKDYGVDAGNREDEINTLKVSIEENEGDILNTSRKATFTFPEGIEVVGVKVKGVPGIAGTSSSTLYYDDVTRNNTDVLVIDENVVTIRNYYTKASESNKTDMDIEFILNAAPTFSGDVDVTLGGEFDDVELTVATVKAPYTVEAKTSEVLIDYRYVPVNEIVITEAEEGILVEGDVIILQVEKMDFEDAGKYEVTSGDIEADVTINDGDDDIAQLEVEITDESTEASTITISGLELYLDRTLPVGGYALENVGAWGATAATYDNDRSNNAANILWENSSDEDVAATRAVGYDENGIFKYKAVTCNDSYVEVVTAGRDNDDSTTTRKIVITIGATTMAVGTETVTLDTPAYINAENYTELPLRAVSEAFGATVGWDDASRTVTIMMGQRIVSMTIGSKTMYINGTPVAMNTAPEITNERTFVPVRDLANALGITKIDWNEASATVTLN